MLQQQHDSVEGVLEIQQFLSMQLHSSESCIIRDSDLFREVSYR